jgi:cardiolipin synthase
MGRDRDPARWRDLALVLRGPVVAEFEDIFRCDWEFTSGEKIAVSRAPSRAGEEEVQVVASGPDVPTDTIFDNLLAAFFAAKSRIWIATPYFIPDETLTRALEIACRRGIDIRILVPRRSNHFLADVGRGSYIRQLEAQGARILLHPEMVHAKATLIDETCAIVGSANTDMRSFFYNYEASAFLYSPRSIEAVRGWFERLSAEASGGYPRPRLGTQTVEGVARILSPFL